MKRLAAILAMFATLAAATAAVSVDAPRREWREKMKARPAQSEARKMRVTLPAPPLTLETLAVTLETREAETSVFEVSLLPWHYGMTALSHMGLSVDSRAHGLQVSLMASPQETFAMAVSVASRESAAADLILSLTGSQSTANPLSLTLSFDPATQRAEINRLLIDIKYDAEFGTPAWLAMRKGNIKLAEKLAKRKQEEPEE